MFNTSQNDKMVEVLSGPERRRRRTPQEKIAIIQQTMEPRYDRVSCRAPAWHQCKPDIQMAQAILRRFTDGCCIGRGSGAGLRTRCRQ